MEDRSIGQILQGSFSAAAAVDRMYRSQILQVNMRWKALAEIYTNMTIHSVLLLSNIKFYARRVGETLPKFADFRFF